MILWALALAVAAPPAKAPSLTGGFFFDKPFADTVLDGSYDPFKGITGAPWNVAFAAGGKLTFEQGNEDGTCDYKIEKSEGMTLRLSVRCGNREDRLVKWTFLDKDHATTDFFCTESSPVGCAKQTYTRLPKSSTDIRHDYDKRFEAKMRPRVKGEWKDPSGAVLVIPDKGQATLDKQKRDIAVIDCLDGCSADAPRTFCVALAEPDPERKYIEGSEEGLAIFLYDEKSARLVEHEHLGVCPNGVAFSAVPDPRVFSATKTKSP